MLEMFPKKAREEFLEVIREAYQKALQSHCWDYKKLGGMVSLQLAAASGNKEAKDLLETKEVQETLAQFKEALKTVIELDPLDQGILSHIKTIANSSDPIYRGLANSLYHLSVDEARDYVIPELNTPDDDWDKEKKVHDYKIRVPRRPAEKQRWIAIWRKIRPMAEKGDSQEKILAWLKDMHASFAVEKDTLRDIITAGREGLLHGQ